MLSRRRFLASASALAAGAALPLTPASALAAPPPRRAPRPGRPKNVILLIPDGFGAASLTMARLARGERLALDAFVTGAVETRSADNFVTDSAAAGTAFASGIRTYNGALGLDEARRPVATVLEAAKARGLRTGLVTTTRMTHATPAAFAAHVPSRNMEEEIAVQMLAVGPDVLLGGGREFFLPRAEGGRRTDGRNLFEEAREAGYTFVQTARELEASSSRRLLGIFSENHLAYEVDRPATEQPSLAAMARKALAALDGPEGFFVMIEGGRIDHAGHGNDAIGHLHDTFAFDDAVAVALEFAERDGQTLVVSVADHETGGLSIGRDGIYGYEPEILLAARASSEGLSRALRARLGDRRPDIAAAEEVLLEHAPIERLDDEERAMLATALQSTSPWEPGQTMAGIVGRRALVGWTTGGHTGEDVSLHAMGPGMERFTGHLYNFEIGQRIAEVLELDLEGVTADLRARMPQEAAVPQG